MSTYKTNTSTWQMRAVQYLLIASSLIIILGNGYKYMTGSDYSLLNLFTGFCFLFQGIIFPKMFTLNAITIDQQAIRNFHPPTKFESGTEEKSNWSDIKKIILSKFSVRVTEKSRSTKTNWNLKKKFRLPVYNRSQFQEIKSEIKHLAKENGVTFETRSWW